METIKIEGWVCKRCNYNWIPRIKKKVPICCPKCKSPYWNTEYKKRGKRLR